MNNTVDKKSRVSYTPACVTPREQFNALRNGVRAGMNPSIALGVAEHVLYASTHDADRDYTLGRKLAAWSRSVRQQHADTLRAPQTTEQKVKDLDWAVTNGYIAEGYAWKQFAAMRSQHTATKIDENRKASTQKTENSQFLKSSYL